MDMQWPLLWLMKAERPAPDASHTTGLPADCLPFVLQPGPGHLLRVSEDECAKEQHVCAASVAEVRRDSVSALRELWRAVEVGPDERAQEWAWSAAEVAESDFVTEIQGRRAERASALEAAYSSADAALAWVVAHGESTWRDHARCRRIRNAGVYLLDRLPPARRAALERDIAAWEKEFPRCHDGDELRPGGATRVPGDYPRPVGPAHDYREQIRRMMRQ